jgi:iron complex transport system substrate-binding protein
MKKVFILLALTAIALLLLLLLAGCQAANTSTPPANSPAIQQAATSISPTIAISSTPASITDDIGRKVQLKSSPQRIISLSPSNTEMVYALGLEDRLIGVTTYCNYPEAAKSKPQVSEYSIVNIEKIVSLQPDLVLADYIHVKETVPALEKLGIPVVVFYPGTIDEVIKDIYLLGNITGQSQGADKLAVSLEQRVKAVIDKAATQNSVKPRVLYITWYDPIWTAGNNTMIDDLIQKVGGSNIAGDLDGWATITLEQVVQRNPQIIVVMSSMGVLDDSVKYINSEPRLKSTDALKNQQVYPIDADIFGRTTPRIVDGLETLAKIVHPETFK